MQLHFLTHEYLASRSMLTDVKQLDFLLHDPYVNPPSIPRALIQASEQKCGPSCWMFFHPTRHTSSGSSSMQSWCISTSSCYYSARYGKAAGSPSATVHQEDFLQALADASTMKGSRWRSCIETGQALYCRQQPDINSKPAWMRCSAVAAAGLQLA